MKFAVAAALWSCSSNTRNFSLWGRCRPTRAKECKMENFSSGLVLFYEKSCQSHIRGDTHSLTQFVHFNILLLQFCFNIFLSTLGLQRERVGRKFKNTLSRLSPKNAVNHRPNPSREQSSHIHPNSKRYWVCFRIAEKSRTIVILYSESTKLRSFIDLSDEQCSAQ